MEHLGWVPIIVALLGASAAAVTDVWKFRVYNILTVPLAVTGLIYHGFTSGWYGLSNSGLGMLFGFCVLIVPYLLGLMGGGDVKLMASVGAWLGLSLTVVAFVVSAMVAGVYAVLLIVLRGKLGESWMTLKLIFYRFAALGVHLGKEDMVEQVSAGADRRLRVIPFGATVPLGVIGVLVWLVWVS